MVSTIYCLELEAGEGDWYPLRPDQDHADDDCVSIPTAFVSLELAQQALDRFVSFNQRTRIGVYTRTDAFGTKERTNPCEVCRARVESGLDPED